MKMRKLFAGLLATSIVAAGTSAFATEIANDAGYDKTAGTYSIVSDLSGYGADQMTILIIPEAAYNAGSINDADILYIDQAAANTENIFKSVGILGGTTLAEGTYYAKIGGENIAEDGIIVEKFTIAKKDDGTPYMVADVDGNKEITIGDVTTLIDFIVGNAKRLTVSGTETVIPYLVGDVDNNEEITIGDVTTSIDYIVGNITAFARASYTLPAGTTAESTYPQN